MGKNFKKICISLIMWLGCISVVYPQSVSISEIMAHSEEFDGKEVVIEAEVIGDIMKRGDYSWININDGSAAIGVYLDTKEVEKIHKTGAYERKGDRIKITGIFHRAYNEQGGELAIEGKSLEVIEQGRELKNSVPIEKVKMLLSMIVVTGLILSIKALKHWRNEKSR